MTTARFRARVNQLCQRGLHWIYSFAPDVDQAALARRLRTRAALVHGVERWGQREVTRLIWQFRFELRLNIADGELSFIHRTTTSPDDRAADRAWFEGQLHEWLADAQGAA